MLEYVWRGKQPSPGTYQYDYIVWRRRYPEWWWGNFYRAEVLGATICGALLIASLIWDRKKVSNKKGATMNFSHDQAFKNLFIDFTDKVVEICRA